MAWKNNNVQEPADNKQYAVDWESKKIPLSAYQNALISKESYLQALKGSGVVHLNKAKNDFCISLVIFFDSVEPPFVRWLGKSTVPDTKNKNNARKSVKFDDKEINANDYYSLMGETNNIDAKKLFLLFQTLKNWCMDEGVFATHSETTEDIFKQLEEEE